MFEEMTFVPLSCSTHAHTFHKLHSWTQRDIEIYVCIYVSAIVNVMCDIMVKSSTMACCLLTIEDNEPCGVFTQMGDAGVNLQQQVRMVTCECSAACVDFLQL